jgi:protein-L-isoaspartate(D-aspartate) O-methyltransferase
MDKQTELAIVRRAYAKQMLSYVDVRDERIEAAFAAVPREDFLGPGPWQTFRGVTIYATLPDADPVYLYTDRLFALVGEKGVNNGQPSLHVALMSDANVGVGQHVVHVGAGTGYYTAILAEIVGEGGRVTAIEFDEGLAAKARANLAGRSNVKVIHGDACGMSFDPVDVVYVNAGFSRVPLGWLDSLRDGGRVILPLGTRAGFQTLEPGKLDMARLMRLAKSQIVFHIERRGEGFHVRPSAPAAFIPAEGQDPVAEERLVTALETGDSKKVTRLYRSEDIPEERVWLRGEGWCLAYS